MQSTIRNVLLGWFIVLNGFLLIPSYRLLRDVGRGGTGQSLPIPAPPSPPVAPIAPTIDAALPEPARQALVTLYEQQGAIYEKEVAAYRNATSAYNEQVKIYREFADSTGAAQRVGAYKVVVQDTLLSLLSTVLAAFITYALVPKGLQLLDNIGRRRKGQPSLPITDV